jgi:transcriptional regulator with XRE-family HTH domain
MSNRNAVNVTKLPSQKDHLRALGSRIVERRSARGWKQRELARRTGIEPGRLSRIERGLAAPSLDEVARLKDAFGGSVDELLFGEAPAGPEGSLDQLARDIDRLGSRGEIAVLRRLFQLLVRGYRQEQQQPATRGDRA